jgi:Fic family protein
VEKTAIEGVALIKAIKSLMEQTQTKIRTELPKLYSKDLLENLFKHPYTKIEFMMQDVGVGRLTATRYLDQLTEIGLLEKRKIWRTNYYIHTALFNLLLRGGIEK